MGKDKRSMNNGAIRLFVDKDGIKWCAIHYTKDVSEKNPCEKCMKRKGK